MESALSHIITQLSPSLSSELPDDLFGSEPFLATHDYPLCYHKSDSRGGTGSWSKVAQRQSNQKYNSQPGTIIEVRSV